MTLARNTTDNWALASGYGLLMFVAGITLVTSVCLILGFSIGSLTTSLAWLTGFAALWICTRGTLIGALVSVIALVMSLALASFTYDPSFDGQWYHQQSILALLAGWNPYHTPFDIRLLTDQAIDLFGSELWSQHYPKATWLAGATLAWPFDTIQAAKAVNGMLAAAAGLIAYARLCQLGWPVWSSLAVAALAALNPVTVTQLATFYVDGISASLLTIIAFELLATRASPQPRALAAVAAALVLLVNMKFTMMVTGVLACVLAMGCWWFTARALLFRGAAALLVAGLVGAFLVGWAPYGQNLIEHQHPFYPVMGSEDIDVIDANRPAALDAINPVHRFARGTWGSTTFPELSEAIDVVMPPFSFTGPEFARAGVWDARFGGFGVLMPEIMLLALLALALLLRERQAARAGLIFAAAVLATVLINPESWWARYVPQMWLVFGALGAWAMLSQTTVTRAAGWALVAVMLANAALTGASAARFTLQKNQEMRAEQTRILAQGRTVEVAVGPFIGAWQRLREAGIEAELRATVDALACDTPQVLTSTWNRGFYCPIVNTP